MSMHTYPLNDDDFEEVTIAAVRAEERSGGWSIERSDGWSFFVPKSSPVAPEVGMLARFYPRGVGFSVRGLFLNGQEAFYRTAAEQKQHEREQRYGKDAADLVRKWDADETIWSITLGGFGPGYEQALHVAAVEFAREGLDVPLEGDRETFFREGWDEVCNHALERIKPWFSGLSGAQFGAAKWLAWQWVHGAGPAFVADPKYQDRTIQVSRCWVPGCAAHVSGVPPSHELKEKNDASSTTQAPDVGVDVAGPVRSGSGNGQAGPETDATAGAKAIARLRWLHSPESHNVDGWEWGIFRVRWLTGNTCEAFQTGSDFSDLDAAMSARGVAVAPVPHTCERGANFGEGCARCDSESADGGVKEGHRG